MEYNVIKFGKYADKGYTIPQLVIKDPNYLSYLVEKKFLYGPLRSQADAVYAIATQLDLPLEKRETDCVQYLLDQNGKLSDVKITPLAHLSKFPADNEIRSSTLNLLWKTDTIGRRLILGTFREYWMNGESLTAQRLEAFFSQP